MKSRIKGETCFCLLYTSRCVEETGMYAGGSLANNWEWGRSYGFTVQSPTGPEKMSGGDNSYEYLYDDGPCSNLNSFDWGLTTSFGVEVDNWVMNVGYELSLGDEGDNYSRKWMNGGSYEVRSIGSNLSIIHILLSAKLSPVRFKLRKCWGWTNRFRLN